MTQIKLQSETGEKAIFTAKATYNFNPARFCLLILENDMSLEFKNFRFLQIYQKDRKDTEFTPKNSNSY